MPDKIKEAFEATKDNGIFLDEEDFRSSLSKEPKAVFELFKADKKYADLFLDYDDFENSLDLKKKDFQGFSQELPKPAMPSGEKFTQGVGLGVKPISSTASPSASKQPKSTIPSESTGEKSKQAPFQNVDISRPELEVAKYDKVQERNRIQNYSQGLQKVQIDAEKKIKQRDELLAGIEQMQVDLEASKGNPEQYNALIPQYNELVNNAKSLTNEISSDFNKMDIFEKGIGVTELKRQINEDTIGNRALEGVNNAKRIVLEAFPATAQVASYLTMRSRGIDPQTAEKVSTDIVENGFPNLKRWSRELAEENEDLRSVFDQTTAWDVLTEKDKSLLEKDWAKIGELSAKELVQTLPTTLAIMGTYINPIAGATTTIMGTAGMELEEMQGSNMTPDAKIANALTKGGLEYATEKVFGSIPMLKRAIGMKSKAGQEAYQNIVLETWNKFASKMGFAADVIEEVGSEMLNTIGGNYTDYLSGKTTEADLYKGLGETFTTSLTMASTLSGAGRAVKYGNKKINELRNATKKLKEISESQETTPEVLQVIQDKIVENNEKIAAEAKVEKKVFDSMDDKTWSETTTLIQETQSLEQQLENNEVPEDVIPLVEDKIKEGYEKIDELTKKAKENAIQEPSTGEVLQRQQEEAGITGSERTGVEQGEQGEEVAQEGQAKEEVVKTFSPKEIESGKQEVDAIKTGKTETTNPIRLFKGLFGKRNPDGTRKTAHSGVKGVFSAVDEKIAEKYKGEDGVGTFDIPSGTTIEVIEVKDRNVPMSKFRQQETDAINNSDAQIVKLITMDARGAEEQYIIKDPALIEKMQRPEAQEVIKEREVSEAKKVSALRDVESTPSENKASEPSKSDKNYQDAQNINSIVSKENPDASVLIQPKGDNLVLTAIYVGKGKRRGGIGSKALETIKREAKKLGKKVVLDATNELDQETDLERLGNFYERNGFKKVGENTYEYDPKNEASSGDTSARTDNTGAEVGDTASVTDKRQSGKGAVAEAQKVPALRDVESTAKGLENVKKESPISFEETGKGVKMIGGIIDAKIAAVKGDKISDVKKPSVLNFLPKEIKLTHLSKSKEDKSSILKEGFDENMVSIDSPIQGIYFSSEDWSTMERFGRTKENIIYATIDNDGLLYFDSANGLRNFLKENKLPSEGQTLDKSQMEKLRQMGVKGILLREDFASQSRNELIVIDKSIIKNISETPEDITKLPSSFSDTKSIAEAYHKAKQDGSNPELVQAVEELLSKEQKKDIKKQEFTENVLEIAKETGLSPQQIENTYKKYDGSKDIEEITIEDYKNARATGDKAKLEVSAKAFDALLQQENAKTSTSPTAKKNAEKSLKEADEKALKEASKIMEHINEIRAKLQESGIIKSTSCKWGK